MAVYPQEPDALHYWQPEAPNGMLEAAQQDKINVTQKEKRKSQKTSPVVCGESIVRLRGSSCFVICKAL